MRTPRLLPVLGIALATVSLWALANRPSVEPPWPAQVRGYAFSPMQADDDPLRGELPGANEVEQDLELLAAAGSRAVRSYGADGALARLPVLAARHGLALTLGVHLDGDSAADQARLDAALRAQSDDGGSVERLLVGNETLLRGDLELAELATHLDRARRLTRVPVSTAEPWHVWLRYPELAAHVDYIAAHVLPYWEGVPLAHAVDYVAARRAELERRFPDKPILLAEVGWPSDGRPRGEAIASPASQASFLRRFLVRAEAAGWDYFLLEAFDQPWKRAREGAVGAYWGVYDVQREPKFAFAGAVVRIPHWPALAGVSLLLACLLHSLLTVDAIRLRTRGRIFLALVAVAVSTPLVHIAQDYAGKYLDAADVLVGVVLALGCLAVVLVLLAEAHEWAEAHWCGGRRRQLAPPGEGAAWRPRVAVHVPVHDEPPELVCRSLRALAALDYPDFTVLVIDNNTADPARWRPVQRQCASLGERFGFVHVDGLAGYKAGALNLALRRTDPTVEVVAVIDSDYEVAPGWLRDLAPLFADEGLAVVQAPQDYRDAGTSLFKSMCHAEYRGFFHIGMVTRNDRDAIIQHGTMTLVRRSALQAAGGWAEWTVTEDAELGLRLFEHGHSALYVPRSYGRGVTPDGFLDYKRQRHRWVLGAMQILRAHAGALFSARDRRLRAGQRYHFVAGWLPWLADGLNLVFSLAAIAWCVLMVSAPLLFDPPLIAFSALPLSLFAFRLAKLACLYRAAVRATVPQTFAAAVAGLALTHTVGRAVLSGLARGTHAFERTPKFERRPGLAGALRAAREEAALAFALITCALAVGATQAFAGLDVRLWQAVLLVQSMPYLAAVALSLIAALPGRRGVCEPDAETETAGA